MTTTSESAPVSRRHPLDARTLRVLTIAATSYVGRLAGVLAVLITIPVARSALPAEGFGIWMMLTGLLAFFAFADLGVGNSVLNRITAAHARGDGEEIRRVTAAGYVCMGAIALVLVALWGFWAVLAPSPTRIVGPVTPEYEKDVLPALHVFAILLAANIPASLAQRLQLGMQAGHWVGLVQAASAVGTLIAVPAMAAIGAPLVGYVLASLGVQVAANAISTWLWHRRQRLSLPAGASLAQPRPDTRSVVSLLRAGSQFLVLQIAVAFGFQSDSIVIAHSLGHAAYGDFAVVQRVFVAASSILLAGLAGLWPAIGQALARGDLEWVRATLRRSYAIVVVASASISIFVAIAMPALLRHWVGMEGRPPLVLLAALAAWAVIEAVGTVSGAFLNAASLLRAQVVVALIMSALAFAGKWYLVDLLGAAGAVVATLLAYVLTSLPMQIYLIQTYLHQPDSHRGKRLG